MPSFRFDARDGRSPPASESVVLPALEDAQNEAVRRIGVLMSRHPRDFWQFQSWALDVTDDTGLVLLTLTVSATWHLAKTEPGAAPQGGSAQGGSAQGGSVRGSPDTPGGQA